MLYRSGVSVIPNLQQPRFLNPTQFVSSFSFSFKIPAMSQPKVVVEYAKSGRSSCKKCSKSITESFLRLGLVSKDPRGFPVTKWHHLSCFPFGNSDSCSSAEGITGFSSLKSSDQEHVKNMVNEKASEKDCDNEANDDFEGRSAKKQKVTGMDIEVAISASDIKDNYKDAILPPKWKAFQTLIFLERDDSLQDSPKIAAFDFDGCLAKTSVKRVGADAWSLMYPSIPERLQSLYNDGYKLAIFTNESNIDRWKNKRQVAIDSKLGRLESFIKLVKVPIQVFVACGVNSSSQDDPFRKPNTGMWKVMAGFNSRFEIDFKLSFYVGDAAGRSDDHSDADLKFAQAVGLKFYVPEEFFINQGD